MHTHQCIKPGCSNSYQDSDPEAYYCQTCNEARKQAAIALDKKFANRLKKQAPSLLQTYDNSPKVRGFINAKDLGITF